jgi:hypothetical protein
VLVDRAGGDKEALMAAGVADADRRWLDRWAVARTPLLRAVHPDGAVSLHGPTHAVTGLGYRSVVPVTGVDAVALERWLDHGSGRGA